MNTKGFMYAATTIVFIMILVALILFYSEIHKKETKDASAMIRCDELHYFVEGVKEDLSRELEISGRRSAIYTIDVIGEYTRQQMKPTPVCSNYVCWFSNDTYTCQQVISVSECTFNGTPPTNTTQLNGVEAAIAEMIIDGTLYSNESDFMINHTISQWISKIENKGREMGINTTITLTDITIIPFDGWQFLIVPTLRFNVSERTGQCYYDDEVSTYSLAQTMGLEDPLFSLYVTIPIFSRYMCPCTEMEDTNITGCADKVSETSIITIGCGNAGNKSGSGSVVFCSTLPSGCSGGSICNATNKGEKILVIDTNFGVINNPNVTDCINGFAGVINYQNLAVSGNITIPWITGTGCLENSTCIPKKNIACGVNNNISIQNSDIIGIINGNWSIYNPITTLSNGSEKKTLTFTSQPIPVYLKIPMYVAVEYAVMNLTGSNITGVYPGNLTLDVGNYSTEPWEWNYSGEFNTTQIADLNSTKLSQILDNCSCNGCRISNLGSPCKDILYCEIPVIFNSGFNGTLNLSDINITYSREYHKVILNNFNQVLDNGCYFDGLYHSKKQTLDLSKESTLCLTFPVGTNVKNATFDLSGGIDTTYSLCLVSPYDWGSEDIEKTYKPAFGNFTRLNRTIWVGSADKVRVNLTCLDTGIPIENFTFNATNNRVMNISCSNIGLFAIGGSGDNSSGFCGDYPLSSAIDLTFGSECPRNVSMDIGCDGVNWNYSGVFSGTDTYDFTIKLNETLKYCNCTCCVLDGNLCTIPVVFNYSSAGKLIITKNILVENDSRVSAPSFFDRLEGNLELSEKYQDQSDYFRNKIGLEPTSISLESFVNVRRFVNYEVYSKTDLERDNYTCVGHLHFGQNLTGTKIYGTYDWFLVDWQHLRGYFREDLVDWEGI